MGVAMLVALDTPQDEIVADREHWMSVGARRERNAHREARKIDREAAWRTQRIARRVGRRQLSALECWPDDIERRRGRIRNPEPRGRIHRLEIVDDGLHLVALQDRRQRESEIPGPSPPARLLVV